MDEYSVVVTTGQQIDALTDEQLDAVMDSITPAHGAVGGERGRMALTLTVEADDMPAALREGLAVVQGAARAAGVVLEVAAVEVRTGAEFARELGAVA